LNRSFDELQKQLREFVEEHGRESKGAVAEVSIKLKGKVEDPDDDYYSFKTDIQFKPASEPSFVSRAFGGTSQDGRKVLLVRTSGSDEDDPRQLKLATNDGRTIRDGEVLEED